MLQFAGAAQGLRRAYIVNPYDIDGMKATLLEAFAADDKETSRRMRAMRRTVVANDVSKSAADFLARSTRCPTTTDRSIGVARPDAQGRALLRAPGRVASSATMIASISSTRRSPRRGHDGS